MEVKGLQGDRNTYRAMPGPWTGLAAEEEPPPVAALFLRCCSSATLPSRGTKNMKSNSFSKSKLINKSIYSPKKIQNFNFKSSNSPLFSPEIKKKLQNPLLGQNSHFCPKKPPQMSGKLRGKSDFGNQKSASHFRVIFSL